MEDYKEYEEQVKKNIKRNEKFINEFETWLNEKGLGKKTIRKHLSNINLYLNDYLSYYDVITMEDGIKEVCSFLGGWFIEKCLWASKTSLKETAASIKKFYKCMNEKNYISNDDYKDLCSSIKEEMDDFLETLDDFDNGIYYDMFY